MDRTKKIRLNVTSQECRLSAVLHTLCSENFINEQYYRAMESSVDFNITRNLFDALHHLRNPTAPRILWVDMLSINQGNVNERGHQVGMMRMIYSKASLVAVWLGRAMQGRQAEMAKSYPEY